MPVQNGQALGVIFPPASERRVNQHCSTFVRHLRGFGGWWRQEGDSGQACGSHCLVVGEYREPKTLVAGDVPDMER